MSNLTLEQYIAGVANAAFHFVEFYTPWKMYMIRELGYDGPDIKRFHPTPADKMIIRQMTSSPH